MIKYEAKHKYLNIKCETRKTKHETRNIKHEKQNTKQKPYKTVYEENLNISQHIKY